MSDNIVDRAANRLFKAITSLPLGKPGQSGDAGSYRAKIENPALRFRELQLSAEKHAVKFEARARFWSKANVLAGRLVLGALIVSLVATGLVVREIRYQMAVRKQGNTHLIEVSVHKAANVPQKFSLSQIRVPFRISIPTAVLAGGVAYGGRLLHRRVRRRSMLAFRKRDDFTGFVIRRRHLLHPLQEDCDLLEQHLQRINQGKPFRTNLNGTWLQTWLSRLFSGGTLGMKPAPLGRLRLW